MLLGKGDAAIADRLVEARDCREAAVGERFVDERPQMLGRLQFGAVGGLEDEADAVGRGQVLWAVPASIVELKHDALLGPGADRLGEISENELEHLLADGVADVPHCPAARRLDEPGHIKPLETMMAEALIASAYLAGVNTRRVRRALAALLGGAVGKDIVSRTWRKVKGDWDAWNARSLTDEPIVRLILDGTVVRVRLDRKATAISLLVVIGVRADGQKVLLAVRSMGGESAEAWRAVLDDLIKRGLRRPDFLIVDGAAGLDAAIAAVWDDVPVQRCTVHKHRNLLAHAPERLHDEITADYSDMIYAATPEEIEARRKAFIRKWRLKHRAVADSLEEAGERLFAFAALPPSQWKSARTTNAIERLHEEFKRRIKTQTVLPSAETAAMLFWALLASGQINMRKIDGWRTLATSPIAQPVDLAA